MATESQTVRRTVQLKFTLPTAEFHSPRLAGEIGDAVLRGIRRPAGPSAAEVDDPARFIQEIEYDTPEVIELNRQRVAGDPQVQAYLRTWRSLLPGAVEIDVYQDVS